MDPALTDSLLIARGGWSAATTAFVLILVAELGDKSQIVCMSLATRYRALPVFFGATLAFMGLNLLAVLFGAGLAAWIPRDWLALAVAALFVYFGVQSLRAGPVEDCDDAPARPHWIRGPLVTTFVLIGLAEFGDKTQLAVAGLGSAAQPLAVWLGASLALALTTALGVWLGGTLLRRIPLQWLHRLAGLLFLAMAVAVLATLY